MRERPVILGMATSRPHVPELAPADGAGKRLCELAVEYGGLTRNQYLEAFDRRNLLPYPWAERAARAAGRAAREDLTGREVLVLGTGVWLALGLPDDAHFFTSADRFTLLPHPSGRNRMLNDIDVRRAIGKVLGKAARGERF
jgi:hypothetical protein